MRMIRCLYDFLFELADLRTDEKKSPWILNQVFRGNKCDVSEEIINYLDLQKV